MRWSKSQREMIDLAEEPVRGFPLDVVAVQEWQSGVSSVLTHIARVSRNNTKMPLSILLDGAGAWDATVSLSKHCEKASGLGYFDRMEIAMRQLSGDEKRPLILWLDEARLMRPAKRELFVAHVDYTARFLRIPVRTVMVIGKVMVFDSYKQKRVEGFPPLGDRLLKRARSFTFSRTSFEEERNKEAAFAIQSA